MDEDGAPYGPETARRQRLTRELLAGALRRAGGNKARAARLLGVSRQTVYRKLAEFGMADADGEDEGGGGD